MTYDLEERTGKFGEDIIKFCKERWDLDISTKQKFESLSFLQKELVFHECHKWKYGVN